MTEDENHANTNGCWPGESRGSEEKKEPPVGGTIVPRDTCRFQLIIITYVIQILHNEVAYFEVESRY